jgi:hypothetical protein
MLEVRFKLNFEILKFYVLLGNDKTGQKIILNQPYRISGCNCISF